MTNRQFDSYDDDDEGIFDNVGRSYRRVFDVFNEVQNVIRISTLLLS